MKHLMRLRAVRVIAILLSAIFAATTFLTFMLAIEMADRGFYGKASPTELKRDVVYSVAYDTAYNLFWSCELDGEELDDKRAEEYANEKELYYSIYHQTIYNQMKYCAGRNYSNDIKFEYSFTYTICYEWYTDETPEDMRSREYRVVLYIPEDRTCKDDIYYADKYFGTVYENRYNVIIGCAVSALLTVLTYAFAVAAAGKRRGTHETVMTFFDKIPFDVLLFAEFWLALAAYVFCDAWWNDVVTLAAITSSVFIGSITLTLLSMTAVVRIKNRTFIKNNVTVMLIRGGWRLALKIIGAIPLFWRTLLGTFVLLVFDFISVFVMVDGGFPIPYIFLWMTIIVCVSLAAYNMSRLKKGAERIASGELDYKIPTDNLFFDFKRHAENLNSIGDGMSAAVEERMRGERFKTELITNVSHDIKTPVTSIINYVDLLDKCGLENDDAREYVGVLKRQSEKLKKLTEDIVEASKASAGVIAVDCKMCDLAILISQAAGEYEERFASAGLTLVSRIPEAAVPVFADGKLIFRIFDNLLGNALKYSLPGTRVHLSLAESDGYATVSVVNVSRDPLPYDGNELTERFVRGDASRHTDGSGLGLSIAKSLAELQGGELTVKTDGDFFKAAVRIQTVANGENL